MTLIEEMERYASAHEVPIMQKEGIAFLCTFLKEHDCKNILEIGSAIGYSAICMAMVDPSIHVTTIERDLERYQMAEAYVARSACCGQITLIYGDALETRLQGSYDLLFIDAAKAQYIKFFERYESLLVPGGYVVSDNLKFHGLVEHPETITSRNLRALVRKIRLFVDYLKQREDYETTFYDFGDGVGISQKKG